MFGGEGRATVGSDVRPTDSHEVFLYDPKVLELGAVPVLSFVDDSRGSFPPCLKAACEATSTRGCLGRSVLSHHVSAFAGCVHVFRDLPLDSTRLWPCLIGVSLIPPPSRAPPPPVGRNPNNRKESRWQAVETGHAFPASRHGHSMPTVAGWTPPSFHPDGTLTAAELAPQRKTAARESNNDHAATGQRRGDLPAEAERRGRADGGAAVHFKNGTEPAAAAAAAAAAAILPTEAATFQWGSKAPTCAVVFGGLNSMYVNPEVWMLPLRWGEKAVQFFPPNPEPEPKGDENENHQGGARGELGGLGFATAVRLKRAAALAASTARRKVASAAAGANGGGTAGGGSIAEISETGIDAWRLFQAGSTGGEKGAGKKHRRASLPGGFSAAGAAALGFEANYSQQQDRHQQGEGVANRAGGGEGVLRPGEDGGGDGGILESAAEIEVSQSTWAPSLGIGVR